MRSIARITPVIALLLLLSTAISSQPQPPVDFKSGENTWSTTAVGDWVEYELKAGPRVRYELKAVAEDDTLTIEIVNYDSDGKENARREITRARDKAPTLAKLVAEGAVWTRQELPIGEAKLACDVMTWQTPEGPGEVWFTTDIPCGGIARVKADGADNVWVRAFRKGEAEHRLPGWPAQKAGDFSTRWTTWHTTQPGDWAAYRLSDGSRVSYRLVSREGDMLTIEHRMLDPKGTEVLNETKQFEVTNAIHLGHQPDTFAFFGKSQWKTERATGAGQAFECQLGTWSEDGHPERVWFSRDVPCGGVVRHQYGDTEPVVLLGYGTAEGIVGEGLEGQVQPPDSVEGFGPPITMKLPEKIRKQMRDQGTAITRMRLYFAEGTNTESGASLEFEGMHTEVPVIYAAFVPELCDKLLSYKDWAARTGHYVDLGFEIKTRPKVLKGMTVQIEHLHMQGDTESVLSTFDVEAPKAGDPWEGQRLRGAKPGINRYTLVITYVNAKGESTTERGFSHWVVVNSPPMFEFNNVATAVATQKSAGGLTLLNADVRFAASFLLHHGLATEDCTLRVSRRGERDLKLDALSPDVRRVVAKDAAAPGWQELGRCELLSGMIQGSRVVTVEDSFVKVTLSHGFAAGSNVLPLSEQWEYKFELHHKDSSAPLAEWTGKVALSINNPKEIDQAKLRIETTAQPEPLEVPFQK